jgi:hypothetical protein
MAFELIGTESIGNSRRKPSVKESEWGEGSGGGWGWGEMPDATVLRIGRIFSRGRPT